MVRLARLTDRGIHAFAEWLNKARANPAEPRPDHLLEDSAWSEPVRGGGEISRPDLAHWRDESDVSWIRKSRVGIELGKILDPLRLEGLMTDRGLWSWLALYWIDLITIDDKGKRKIEKAHHYYILDVDQPGERRPGRRYPYRHRLQTPYRIVRELGEDAMFFLGADVRTHGEAIEQVLGRLRDLRIPAVIEVLNSIYHDPTTPTSYKKGCMGQGRTVEGFSKKIPTAGGLRDRFFLQLRRLGRNYSLYSLTGADLEELLGEEFLAWKRKGSQAT